MHFKSPTKSSKKINILLIILIVLIIIGICIGIPFLSNYLKNNKFEENYLQVYSKNFSEITLQEASDMQKNRVHGNVGKFYIPKFMKSSKFVTNANGLEEYSQSFSNSGPSICYVLKSFAEHLFTTPTKNLPIIKDSKTGEFKFYEKDQKGNTNILNVPVINSKETKNISQGFNDYAMEPKIYLRIPYGGSPRMDAYMQKFRKDLNLPDWINSKSIQNLSKKN